MDKREIAIYKLQDVIEDLRASKHFCGALKRIIPDNLKSAIIKASFTDLTVNRSYADLAKHYSFQVDPCLLETPQYRGKVESGVKYVKNNFIPFHLTSIADQKNIKYCLDIKMASFFLAKTMTGSLKV